jgi:hypothetical protein
MQEKPPAGGTLVRATVIEWDGTNVPEELQKLPAGRYMIQPVEYVEDLDELTPEEEAGIMIALDQVKAGEGLPLEEVIRRIRSRSPQVR